MSDFTHVISVSSDSRRRAAVRILSLFFLLSLGLRSRAWTQVGTGIHGRAIDPQGVVLPAVTVTVKGPDGAAQSTVTDTEGQYHFRLLPGHYALSGELPGFSVFEEAGIEIAAWVQYAVGSANRDLPAHMVLYSGRNEPSGGSINWSSGFLPAAYQAVVFRPGHFAYS